MPTITTRDGTNIFYKDWGSGEPILFSHGWPLNGEAWENYMWFFAEHGFRTIAHDRRGHGRSDHPWRGNDMDTYADDLAQVIEALDLRGVTLIGHSTGGGEITRYVGRHGTSRVARMVLVDAIPPVMIVKETNPGGLPREVFDAIRAGVAGDRREYYWNLSAPFFGANRPGSTVSDGLRDTFVDQCMACGIKAAYDCIHEFSEQDFTEDLKRIDVPTLIVHGSDDQIVPIGASAELASKLVRGATLKVYADAPHGLPDTHKDRLQADLLEFMGAAAHAVAAE